MGCCGSQDGESKTRLDNVDRLIKSQVPAADGTTTGLEDMMSCAKELHAIMDRLIDQGAGDKEGISKVESLSDAVLDNLLNRITVDVLKLGPSVFDPLKDQILRIAKELDTVRATKATSIVESHIEAEQGRIDAGASQKTATPMKNIQANIDKMTKEDPKTHLIPCSRAVLELADKAHSDAPDNKKVTDQLLNHIVTMSIHILKLDTIWGSHPTSCGLVKQIAERLDILAAKLVVVMEAVWDPPMAPQVDDVIKTQAEKVCAACIEGASSALAANAAGKAYDNLKELHSWWPFLKDASAHNLEIVGIFSKVHSYANQRFTEATASGKKEDIEGIRGFAGKFDDLRASFDGLPPAADGALGETLTIAEAKGTILKNLGILDAEIAKTTDDDKETNLSLAAVVQALEVVASAWTGMSSDVDEELKAKVDTTCKAVEEWTDQEAAKLPPGRVSSLLKFAEEYDSRRIRIDPSAARLRPRIAAHAATAYLKVTEAQLAKEGGLKPHLLLESLKGAALAIPKEEADDSALLDIRTRLTSAFAAVDARIMKSFQEAMGSGDSNSRKEDMLLKFAEKFDTLQTECGVDSSDGRLVERLQSKRRAMAEESLTKIEEVLAPSNGATDFEAAVQALCLLEQAWSESLAEDSDMSNRFSAVLASLEERLREAGSSAAAAVDAARVDELFELAAQLDASANAIRAKSADAEEGVNLRSDLIGQALDVHLKIASTALADGKLDMLTQELESLEHICSRRPGLSPCPDSACKRVLEWTSDLKLPLLSAAAGGAGQLEAATKVANAADSMAAEARKGKEIPEESMAAALKVVEGVLKKLEEARTETAKASGMNPKVVVQALKDLGPLWDTASSLEGCKKTLLEVLEKLNGKFQEAGKKSLEDEDKLKALLTFSKDADKAQEVLLNKSDGLSAEKNYDIICRVVADKALGSMEAQLSKESGMNPAELLKSAQELVPILSSLELSEWGRWEEVRTKVRTRMLESMGDAVSTSNDKKSQALLKFARDFDAECKKGLVEGDATLEAELKGRMES